jgi:hypothetical protein
MHCASNAFFLFRHYKIQRPEKLQNQGLVVSEPGYYLQQGPTTDNTRRRYKRTFKQVNTTDGCSPQIYGVLLLALQAELHKSAC